MDQQAQEWIAVESASKLKPGEMKPLRIGGRDIVLYNIDGAFHATDNLCTHASAYLSDGWLDGGIIECPLHGGRFEVLTGKGLGPPVPCDIAVHTVRVVGDEVQIRLAPAT